MNKYLFNTLLLFIYAFIGIGIFFKTSLIGSKPGIIILMVCMLILWYATIYFLDKNNKLFKNSKKIESLFNYFDNEKIKELVKRKKKKHERFELFNSIDINQSITILSIKIINNDVLKKLETKRRLKIYGRLLEIIEEKIENKYGIIYNIRDGIITCVFNTVYEIENADFEAISAALDINLSIMMERNDKEFNNIRLDMSIVNENMDFFIRDKRVLLNGDLTLSEELLNIEGEDSIYITEESYKKYIKLLEVEYIGKLYLSKDVKVYKILKIVESDEDVIERTYETSKLIIKKNKKEKLKV